MTSLASVPTAIRSGLRSLVLAGAIGLAAGYVLLQHRWSQSHAVAPAVFPVTPRDPAMFDASEADRLRVPDSGTPPVSVLERAALPPVTIIPGTKSAPVPVFRKPAQEVPQVPRKEAE